MVLIGSTTTYQGDGSFEVPINKLNAKVYFFYQNFISNLYLFNFFFQQLLMGSKSLNGFMLTSYTSDYREYLPKLIGMIAQNKLKAKVDLGETSPGGKFFGVDQIVRAEEWLHSGKNQEKVVVQVNEV